MRRLRFSIAGHLVALAIAIMPKGLIRASFEEHLETWEEEVACEIQAVH